MKKKMLSMLIACMLVCLCMPFLFGMETKAATKYPYLAKVVNTDKVNVRSGPGTNYEKIDTLKKSQMVKVHGIKNSFYKVKKSGKWNNKVAYIHKDYLKKVTSTTTTTPSTPSTPSTNEKYPVTGTLTGDNVNVRTGPGTTYAIKGIVNKGQKVVVTGKEGSYYAVTIIEKYGDVRLYISVDYVKLSDKLETPATPDPTPTVQFPVYGVVTSDNVNVRTGAGASYAIKGVVNKGQRLIVNKAQGDYYQVVIEDKYGDTNLYIYKEYIELGTAVIPGVPANPDQPSNPGPYPADGTVTGGFVNVREKAGTNFPILGQLYYGQKVKVTGENGDFYAAEVPDVFGSATVFLYKEYVTLGEVTLEPVDPPAPTKKTGVINSDIGCNLRKKADASSEKLAVLDYQQKVEILEKTGDWYKVTATVNGKSVTGYCYAQYVTEK
ncbi:MAG: SH3 domain-containing protein [Dorea sp.]|nr:SH3 domain-containing protein [Dorea sp.]